MGFVSGIGGESIVLKGRGQRSGGMERDPEVNGRP